MISQRSIALKIIKKTICDQSFTNLLMRKELEKIESIQRPFVTKLVLGVLKNYDYLLFNLNDYIGKTSTRNKIILIMALYEKFFLSKEDYVVNNEYVNLADNKYDKGFINATLKQINHLKSSDKAYINESLPEWIYKLLSKQYKPEELNIILKNYKRDPITYYHLNPTKANFARLNIHKIKMLDNRIFISENNLLNTDDFKNGLFYIQDINAKRLVDNLKLNKDDIFLDGCSAPGSKLFNALEYIDPKNAYANDINEGRVKLIKNKAEVLGYEGVNYLNVDASTLSKHLNIKFDKILLDVPCSGLGVIGRKPDIKFHTSPESLDELQKIQEAILNDVSTLLKDDGELLYSTCTLNKKENTKQIEKFINNHPDFKIINEQTILNDEGDLFYHCLLKKV